MQLTSTSVYAIHLIPANGLIRRPAVAQASTPGTRVFRPAVRSFNPVQTSSTPEITVLLSPGSWVLSPCIPPPSST